MGQFNMKKMTKPFTARHLSFSTTNYVENNHIDK